MLDKTVLDQYFTTKNQNKQSDIYNIAIGLKCYLLNSSNGTYFYICKKGLHYTLSKFGNQVTKRVQNHIISEKKSQIGVLFCEETPFVLVDFDKKA